MLKFLLTATTFLVASSHSFSAYAEDKTLKVSEVELEITGLVNDADARLGNETATPNGRGHLWGLLYTKQAELRGQLRMNDINHVAMRVIPVVIRIQSVGIYAEFVDMVFNEGMSFANYNGKKLRDLLGFYGGVRAGAEVIAGGKFSGWRNKKGTLIGDIQGSVIGVGVDLSYSWMKILPLEPQDPDLDLTISILE